MFGLRFKAILIGFVVDITASTVAGIQIALLLFLVLIGLSLGQGTIGSVDTQFHDLMESPPLQILNVFVGSFGTVAGGFLTGWISKGDRFKNSLVMGACSALFGLSFYARYSLWFNIVAPILTLACAMAGGYMAERIYGPPPVKRSPNA